MHLFLSPPFVRTKKKKKRCPQKAPKAPKDTSALSVSSHFFFFFFSWTFVSHAFSFLFGQRYFCKIEKKNFLKALSNLADSSAFELPQVGEFTVNPHCERFSKGTLRHAAQKLHFPRCTGLKTTGLLSCSGSCVVIDSSAPLVARAPWTRMTASGPRLCRTSRPAASRRFSGSWR